MTTLESKLSKQKKDATSNMVQEAVQRDIENKEKAAVNEHESDGALDNVDLGDIPIDDDEAYLDSEVALE